jgi:hypothetical protein
MSYLYNLYHYSLQLKRHVVTIDGYSDVPANKEDKLLRAVSQQPISVGICGSAQAFQLYSQVRIHVLVALSLTYMIQFYHKLNCTFIVLLFRVSSMAHAQRLLIMQC